MADPRLRSMQIKTNVVRRIAREKQSYEAEAEKEKTKADVMSENGTEEAVQKKQQEIIQESLMMVNDCRKRLKTAIADLQGVLENEKDLNETEQYTAAQEIIKTAAPHLN